MEAVELVFDNIKFGGIFFLFGGNFCWPLKFQANRFGLLAILGRL
jgi:hypothetical protein